MPAGQKGQDPSCQGGCTGAQRAKPEVPNSSHFHSGEKSCLPQRKTLQHTMCGELELESPSPEKMVGFYPPYFFARNMLMQCKTALLFPLV